MALAVSIWPCIPGIGTFVQVGSHWSWVPNHATGFSCGSIFAVVGLMQPELMIWRNFVPVVKWKIFSGGSGLGGGLVGVGNRNQRDVDLHAEPPDGRVEAAPGEGRNVPPEKSAAGRRRVRAADREREPSMEYARVLAGI
jgi:hypothetical protein